MKILLATYWNIPHVGGVWTYMEQLKEKLESLGHEVDLLGYGEESSIVHIVDENRSVKKDELLPLVKAMMSEEKYPEIYANQLVSYTELQRYVYELGAAYLGLDKYDLIHAQDIISSTCIKRVMPKDQLLVTSLHGSVAYEIRDQLNTIHRSSTSHVAKAYFDHLETIGAMSGDTAIVANNWLKDILTEEFEVPEEKILVSQYGYDIDGFLGRMDTKAADMPLTDKKVILFTGRMIENKGIHHLIESLALLKNRRDDWVCWLAGEGEKLAGLRIQSEQQGIDDNVEFLRNRKDVPYLLSLADIYVLPSLLDNQPLSLIEAQIAGVPAIVSDAGGLPEMVEHEVTGLIVSKGDVNALANSLERLLEDDDFRNQLGNNAREFARKHWDMDEAVTRVLDIYQNEK
ncbi:MULTISPECIES: glycosyltransferase family 4 protein [Bacillus]|uniref:glycosyltransferase family 4 protein n=1 Tax=Bacillus TaxID=1386 RepID=UPI000C79072A|nr:MULTISPECIES: glycosyltransferase family 4 protein [Bacillus]MBU8582988.1 glycosyltransferase family 4 protein [Bacillus paralicheniformis]MCD2371015.1 glycosyltransferase family 4 protein [Bacillus sp. BS3(2021)]MCJ8232408.1 glycosyltransferase family 4 protein [Bacillus paralicheniformis]MCY8037432.1 glycosyltransferase family 4 protein [Bacillus paralicheniformis]MCY8151485.1 glycosyltransferase family 4 protein [Bacillus paralicheniformis]